MIGTSHTHMHTCSRTPSPLQGREPRTYLAMEAETVRESGAGQSRTAGVPQSPATARVATPPVRPRALPACVCRLPPQPAHPRPSTARLGAKSAKNQKGPRNNIHPYDDASPCATTPPTISAYFRFSRSHLCSRRDVPMTAPFRPRIGFEGQPLALRRAILEILARRAVERARFGCHRIQPPSHCLARPPQACHERAACLDPAARFAAWSHGGRSGSFTAIGTERFFALEVSQ